MATPAEHIDVCPECGIALPPPKYSARNYNVAKDLLNPNKTQTQALVENGYAPMTVDKNARAIVGSQRVRAAITDIRRRSLDKATRLSQFADSLLKNANFEGAFSDPREALQAWAIAKKVEQEERKLGGHEDAGLSEDDRIASHMIQRRRAWRFLTWAANNPERAKSLAARLLGASW